MIPSIWKHCRAVARGCITRAIDAICRGFCGISLIVLLVDPALADHPRIDRAYTTAKNANVACVASMAAHNHPPESGINSGCNANDNSSSPRYFYLIYCTLPNNPDGSSHCATEHFYFPIPESNESRCELSGTYPGYSLICSSPTGVVATNKNLGDSCNNKSNPCNAATGNKYQIETDIAPTGALPAQVRYYNSQLPLDFGTGVGWTSGGTRSLENITVYLDKINVSSLLTRRPNGQGLTFRYINNAWQPDTDNDARLTQDGGYTLKLRDGSSELYTPNGSRPGALVSTTTPQGLTTTVTGNSITGPFGHKLMFGIENNRVSTVTDPIGNVIYYDYDNTFPLPPTSRGNLTRVRYPDGTAKIYYYENANYPHDLTGIAFANVNADSSLSNITRYSTYGYYYNNSEDVSDPDNGKAVVTQHAVTDNGSPQEKFTFAYNSTTQTTVTDPAGMNEVMTFTTNLGVKNLVNKVNPSDGKSVQQIFDANNNLTCRKDEENRVTTYAYNASNQRTGMTEGLTGDCTNSANVPGVTRITTYEYLSPTLDLPRFIRRPSVATGQTFETEMAYGDAAHPNLPTQIIQRGFTPAGTSVSRTVTLDYNTFGQVNLINGPRTDVNDVTTVEYYECTTGGACGQLKKVTNAIGHMATYDQYDANGRLKQMTDPNGLVTTYTYDPRGRVRFITQTPPTGTVRVTEYRYTAFGEVSQAIFPDGISLTYAYDAAQDLKTVTDNLGNRVEYRYDLKGNRTTDYTYDPGSTLVRQIDMAYDLRNRVASVNTAGSLTQMIFDAVGNLRNEIDPNNNPATQHAPDALNRLVQTIDRIGGTTAYGYDVNDRPTQVVPPGKAATQYVHDDLGNLLSETSPDRGSTGYTYDAAGNVQTVTDARNIVVSYTYDALNRVTAITYPTASQNVAFTYDTGASCTLGTGRLCQAVDMSGTTQYGYDAFGNITTQKKTELGVTYTTRYSYDAGNRIMSSVYPDGRIVSYTRDPLGRIQGVSATVNGVTQTILSGRSYRADGLFVSQAYGNGLNELRQYDLQGKLNYQFLGSADTRVYTYDPNGNLTQEQNLPQVGNYLYDALDRLTRDQIVTGTTSNQSYTYDGNGNRLTKASTAYTYTSNTNRLTKTGSTALTLDVAGNTLTNGTARYTYNNAGRLRQAYSGTILKGTYTYNYQYQRTRKVAGTTTTVYHYDLLGNLILETSQTGVVRVAYFYVDTIPAAHIRRASNVDTLSYLHTDHEGTPRLATNTTGVKVWLWEGRAFGETAPNQNPDGDATTTTINLRLAGQYFDQETGLHYNWNRYYDPKVGRYITSDPIGLKGGLNTYLYANANPLTWIDPDGLKSFRCTKPLNALGGSGSRSGPDIWGNPLYHQYSCIVRDGKVACGGQDHEGSAVYGPGKPSNDSYSPDRCEETQPDNDCFEKCLVNEWAQPRPNYGIPVGTDCQEYDDDVNRRCRKQCKVK